MIRTKGIEIPWLFDFHHGRLGRSAWRVRGSYQGYFHNFTSQTYTFIGARVHISHWASKFVLSTSSSLTLTKLLSTQGLSQHKIQIEIEADDIPDGADNRKALWYLKIFDFCLIPTSSVSPSEFMCWIHRRISRRTTNLVARTCRWTRRRSRLGKYFGRSTKSGP